MSDRMPDRLSYEDATFLTFDRDWFPYNVGSVGIYDGVIPLDAYKAHVESRLDRVPRYRQRLVYAPLNIAHPAWHDDPAFRIERHISEVVLPPPGDDLQLRALAGEFIGAPLSRDKPLWEILLVQGLHGGRTAHVAKIHHCLVDGIAGVQLMGALLDVEPDPPDPPDASERDPWVPPRTLPGPLETLVDAVSDRLLAQISLSEAVTLALIDPIEAARSAGGIARALQAGLPHLFRIGRVPWATNLTGPTRLAWQRISLDEVQHIRHGLRGTVNDVVLTVLAGALARYMKLHGEETEKPVRVLIPVNVRRKEEQHDLGNRVSFMLAGLPVGLTDPLARFEAIHKEIASLKEIDQAGNLDRLAGLIGRTPPPLQHQLGASLRMPNFIYDFVCTNVPGPRAPLYCLGRRMTEHYPWVPIGWRTGLGVAVMSYDKDLCFSLTGDRSVLADVDRLAAFVDDAFEELKEAAGVAKEQAREEPRPALPAVLTAAGAELRADEGNSAERV
jgi:WS/DGAT/MGAT family acyltransferase